MDVLHHAKTSDEPICRFLSGGAGVGKTHVTTSLYQSLYRYWNKRPGIDPNKPCILLMAPTGKAAYLIRGNTLHSALKIPVNQKLQYKSLDTDSLNTLRMQMMGVKYIFIDEVSMVGSGMLTLFTNGYRKSWEVLVISGGFQWYLLVICSSWNQFVIHLYSRTTVLDMLL